jgi:Icc-related predicted phosphoesterase
MLKKKATKVKRKNGSEAKKARRKKIDQAIKELEELQTEAMEVFHIVGHEDIKDGDK